MKKYLQLSLLFILFLNFQILSQHKFSYHEKFENNFLNWPTYEKDNSAASIQNSEFGFYSENEADRFIKTPFKIVATKDFSYSAVISGTGGFENTFSIGLSSPKCKIHFEIDFIEKQRYRVNYTKQGNYQEGTWKKLKKTSIVDTIFNNSLKIELKGDDYFFYVNDIEVTKLNKKFADYTKTFDFIEFSVKKNFDLSISDVFLSGTAYLPDHLLFMAGKGLSSDKLKKEKEYRTKDQIDDPLKVRKLRIYGYEWKKDILPQKFLNCYNLQEISIESGQDLNYAKMFEQFLEFPCLHRINIRGFKTIPENIGKLQQLKALSFYLCKEKMLPKEVAKLNQLETLVSNSSFEEFPEELSNLQNLKKLNIFKDYLPVPIFIYKLPKLEHLTFRIVFDDIDIKDDIGNLSHLKYLNIENCKLSALPKSIGKLKKLENLNISNTAISSLPASIGQLESLKVLNIGVLYSLTHLPAEIGNLTSLEKIIMNACDSHPCNGLKEIPKEIAKLTKLKALHLGWCHVKSIPKELKQLKNLEYFYINSSELSQDEINKAKQNLQFVKTKIISNKKQYVPEK